MTEFFVTARSFAAPFFSDESTHYILAETPATALVSFAADYTHPAGLYAAEAWASADAYHKGGKPLARWISNHEREEQRLTPEHGGYLYLCNGPGDFEINGERHLVTDPKAGSVIAP